MSSTNHQNTLQSLLTTNFPNESQAWHHLTALQVHMFASGATPQKYKEGAPATPGQLVLWVAVRQEAVVMIGISTGIWHALQNVVYRRKAQEFVITCAADATAETAEELYELGWQIAQYYAVRAPRRRSQVNSATESRRVNRALSATSAAGKQRTSFGELMHALAPTVDGGNDVK